MLGWAIAFHCQQAVEKSYKGAIVLQNSAPPKTHNLATLEDAIVTLGLTGPLAVGLLDALTPFAVDDKYPRLAMVPISREEAYALVPAAQAAVDWLSRLIAGTG